MLNVRLTPELLRTEEGRRKVAALVRSIVDKQVMHIQFNVVSSDTLLAAQREPERHKDLVVRVAGYSAYFVNLPKAMQEEIIVRTEHGSL